MLLAERLSHDYNKALKTGNTLKVSVLRMARAAIKNKEIEKGSSLTDDEIQTVLGGIVKRGRESIDQFSRASRQDLVQKEEEEIGVLQPYLPLQLSSGEISELVKNAIVETGASGLEDFGKLMKAVMIKVRGRADGNVVKTIVRNALEE